MAKHCSLEPVVMVMAVMGTVMVVAKTWVPGVCLQRGNPSRGPGSSLLATPTALLLPLT